MPLTQLSAQRQVWRQVAAIPPGRVATYGQVARLAGLPGQARLVGRILSQLPPDTRLPWHRVVASQGRITNPNAARQRERLVAEGVPPFGGRVSLRDYQWRP